MRRTPTRVVAVFTLTLALLAACGDDAQDPVPFTMDVSPRFINGAVAGARTGVLVTVTDASPTSDKVQITAGAEGAEVTVTPAAIDAGETAEVWVVPGTGIGDGTMLDLIIQGRRGETVETATLSYTVYDWEDDRGEYAGELLELFLTWLEENRPDLGLGTGTPFTGSMVAPELMVVSHYLYLTDDWELGLTWHVMIPPDDFSGLYLRPRTGPAPTIAFRLASQAAALRDGVVDIEEETPPTEVMR
jgi:hypothetical protein